jgi:hypothetical protein
VGSIALFSLVAAAESTGCGSTSNLVIGGSVATALPDGGNGGAGASGGSGGAGAGSGGAEPTDGALDSAADATSDAPSDAPEEAPPPCMIADVAPAGSLLHRYSFDGTGTVAKDSIGGADGEIKPGGALNGAGLLTLDGIAGYVNLPNHLISVLGDATFVAWSTFKGGSGYERIFDFGIGVGEDDTSGQGQSYVAVAPFGGTSRLLMLAKQDSSHDEIQITTAANISDKLEHQVALVFASGSYAELYLDGKRIGRTLPSTPLFSLSDIDDVNDWIGRSQWNNDHTFNGTVDEFRIYGQALTPCAVQALAVAGPGAP